MFFFHIFCHLLNFFSHFSWICWICSIASLDYPVVYLGLARDYLVTSLVAGNCQSLANEVSTVADSVAEMACDSIDDVTGWPQVVMSLEWCLGFVFLSPNDRMITAGWWFQALFIFHFIYGMWSFPLTNSYFEKDGHIAPPTRYDNSYFLATINQVIINHH